MLFADLHANSLDPERTGDLILQAAEGCLFTSYPLGTSHGSPYAYDRDVPLIFWGAGIEAARVPGRAAPIDIAPTLAAWLGLDVPAGLDGRVLPLRAEP